MKIKDMSDKFVDRKTLEFVVQLEMAKASFTGVAKEQLDEQIKQLGKLIKKDNSESKDAQDHIASMKKYLEAIEIRNDLKLATLTWDKEEARAAISELMGSL